MTEKIFSLFFQLSCFPASQFELLILHSLEDTWYNYRIHRLMISTQFTKKPTNLRKQTYCSITLTQVVRSIPKSSKPKNIIKPGKGQQMRRVMARGSAMPRNVSKASFHGKCLLQLAHSSPGTYLVILSFSTFPESTRILVKFTYCSWSLPTLISTAKKSHS